MGIEKVAKSIMLRAGSFLEYEIWRPTYSSAQLLLWALGRNRFAFPSPPLRREFAETYAGIKGHPSESRSHPRERPNGARGLRHPLVPQPSKTATHPSCFWALNGQSIAQPDDGTLSVFGSHIEGGLVEEFLARLLPRVAPPVSRKGGEYSAEGNHEWKLKARAYSSSTMKYPSRIFSASR